MKIVGTLTFRKVVFSMTKKVEELLKIFDEEYVQACDIYSDDDDLGNACDVLRDKYLKEALEQAKTTEDCDAILARPYMDRQMHIDFIKKVQEKKKILLASK